MSIGDRIYDLLWYQLPCDERILVQLIIQFANQPYELKGFGIFVCSFDTFLKVNETKLNALGDFSTILVVFCL